MGVDVGEGVGSLALSEGEINRLLSAFNVDGGRGGGEGGHETAPGLETAVE